MQGNNGNSNGKIPDSVVRVELISFYHRNPDFVKPSEEVVKNFDFHSDQVHGQLEKLVGLKILEKVEVEGSDCYRYLPPFSCGNLKSIRFMSGVNGFKGPSNGKGEELNVQETS